MVREVGIALDRALFPLLVMIERLGPIGIVDLADRVGWRQTAVRKAGRAPGMMELVEESFIGGQPTLQLTIVGRAIEANLQ
ncbi:hypothetical protein AGR8A_pAt30087 [Agrobacterium fabrum str. J-07]|jgi:predicted transcriptional regulator|nr:hypothetical protein AGR8A_pAt30087 [Agrobacterium fabrum str. J-07]